jgi:hypothetical protein
VPIEPSLGGLSFLVASEIYDRLTDIDPL